MLQHEYNFEKDIVLKISIKRNIMIIEFCLLVNILHPLIYLSLRANSPPINVSIT